jgi:hypothetical protein
MRIGCVGTGSLDTTFLVSSASYDHESVMIVNEVVVSVGGKGLVTAIGMLDQGVDVEPLSLVGEKSQIPGMLPVRLGRAWLVPALDLDTQIWLSVSATHEVATWVSFGSSSRPEQELAEIGVEYARNSDALYLSVEETPLLHGALLAARSDATPLAVNLSRPLIDRLARDDLALFARLIDSATILLCSADESVRALSALSAGDWRDVARQDAEIVVTCGSDGGEFLPAESRNWERYEAVAPTTVRSVVGAGDTFNGAFLAARWGRGQSLSESCDVAAAAAARCVSEAGSCLPLG